MNKTIVATKERFFTPFSILGRIVISGEYRGDREGPAGNNIVAIEYIRLP